MYFLFLIFTALFWIVGGPDRKYTTNWLARYLFAGLWYAIFCLAASISYNSWFFSTTFLPNFNNYSDSCKQNAMVLFATVQIELMTLLFCFTIMHRHIYDFHRHRNMYIDLLIGILPWGALILSTTISIIKDSFLSQLKDLSCISNVSELTFISNVCCIWPLVPIFVIIKLLLLTYFAVAGKLSRRYRFMFQLEKGLLTYFYTFILEVLFSTHYQMYQNKSKFTVTDIFYFNLSFQPVQLLLFLPIVLVPVIIYKTLEPVNY